MHTTDICVIGGGPVGCVAASHLAAAGLRVAVCEEHAQIGVPVDCSGVIGTEAFDELQLPRETIRDRLQDLEFVSPSGKRLGFHPGRTLAYIVDRAAFDAALAARASAAGGVIWTNTRVTHLEPATDGVRVRVERCGEPMSVVARAVVLAGGPRYRFQQQLGMGRPRSYLKTLQAEVVGVSNGLPQIFLGSSVAPGSFAWWLPVKTPDGYLAKIGISTTGDAQHAFQEFVNRLRWQGYVRETHEIVPRAWMIPIAPLPRTFTDRVLAVGDAAGQTKPTTGGGLYYGPLCAILAAEVLVEGFRRGDMSSRVLVKYEQRWQKALGRELATARRFRRLFEQLADADIDDLFGLASQDGLVPYLEQEANFDWHRRTILQGVLRLPGAATFFAKFRRKQLEGLFT